MRYIIVKKEGLVGTKGTVHEIEQALLFETEAEAVNYARKKHIYNYKIMKYYF